MAQTLLGQTLKQKKCPDKWIQGKIASTVSQERIQMVFNPPGTIHMGEKEAFGKILLESSKCCPSNQVLTEEVLLTAHYSKTSYGPFTRLTLFYYSFVIH